MGRVEKKYSAEAKTEEPSHAQMLWLSNKKEPVAKTGSKNDGKTPKPKS